MSIQVVSSPDYSTQNNNNGGTTVVNDSTTTPQTNNPTSGGNRLIYINNLTDADYKNYYTNITPALPREYNGVGDVLITGSYTGTGTNIRITSEITISFTGGLYGSLKPVSFSGLISTVIAGTTVIPGTTLHYQKLNGITDPSVPSLPLNLTIIIRNATISSGVLTATISMQFTPAFVNVDSGILYTPLAPGVILSNFSGGILTGSGGTLRTVSFNTRSITHPLFF
jgi:hypothetical protein